MCVCYIYLGAMCKRLHASGCCDLQRRAPASSRDPPRCRYEITYDIYDYDIYVYDDICHVYCIYMSCILHMMYNDAPPLLLVS